MEQVQEAQISEIMQAFPPMPDEALNLLHAVQHRFGFIPKNSIESMARYLNLSRAELWGIVSFYSDFKFEAPAKNTIKICCGESCQAQGANEIAAQILKNQGLEWGQKSPNNFVEIEKIFCLGLCSAGPAAMVNDKLVANIDEKLLGDLV